MQPYSRRDFLQQYLTVPAVLFGPAMVQAYELLQGNLVRFSPDAQTKDVPTAVLVHGILGSKRNLNSFARMLVGVSSSRLVPGGLRGALP